MYTVSNFMSSLILSSFFDCVASLFSLIFLLSVYLVFLYFHRVSSDKSISHALQFSLIFHSSFDTIFLHFSPASWDSSSSYEVEFSCQLPNCPVHHFFVFCLGSMKFEHDFGSVCTCALCGLSTFLEACVHDLIDGFKSLQRYRNCFFRKRSLYQ